MRIQGPTLRGHAEGWVVVIQAFALRVRGGSVRNAAPQVHPSDWLLSYIKGVQAWDFRSLGFPWFLHHKVSTGRRLWGSNDFLKIFRGLFGAAKFLMRMLSLLLRSALPSKHAEHTLRLRVWCPAPPKVKVTSLYFSHKATNPEMLYGVKIMKIRAIENLTFEHL
jgi:hypothetical protein